jgi:hypothetical protein
VLTLLADLNAPAAVSLGLIPAGLLGVVLAFADADPGYFDPRRAVRRAIESGRLDPLLIELSNASAAARDAVLDAVALVLLLTTRPKGALR